MFEKIIRSVKVRSFFKFVQKGDRSYYKLAKIQENEMKSLRTI